MDDDPWTPLATYCEQQAEYWLDRVITDRDRSRVDEMLALFHDCQAQAEQYRAAAAWWRR